MDRPICDECPYWKKLFDDPTRGECRKHPPVIVDCVAAAMGADATANVGDYTLKCVDYASCWPFVNFDEFCGEHPDFPAWIESQRRSIDTPPPAVQDT